MSVAVKSGIIAALLMSCIACSTHHVVYKTGAQTGGFKHEVAAGYFLGGVIGEQTVELGQLCPSGVAVVSARHSVGDRLLEWLTATIYSPMTITVECASGAAFLLEADEANQRTYVSSLPARPRD